jgi:hypothetical protein
VLPNRQQKMIVPQLATAQWFRSRRILPPRRRPDCELDAMIGSGLQFRSAAGMSALPVGVRPAGPDTDHLQTLRITGGAADWRFREQIHICRFLARPSRRHRKILRNKRSKQQQQIEADSDPMAV